MSSRSQPPAPGTGLPLGVEAGPLGKRFTAFLIDLLVPALVLLAWLTLFRPARGGTTGYAGSSALVLLVCVLWFLLVWWMFVTRAAGPGMRVMKLQLVGLRNGRPIGWGRFLVRALILTVLTATVVGLILLLIGLVRNPRRQGWHDLVADSVVIKQRPLAPRRPATVTGKRVALAAPASASPPPKRRAAASGPAPAHPRAPAPAHPRAPAPAPAPAPEPAVLSSPSSVGAAGGGVPTNDSVQIRPRRVAAGPVTEPLPESPPLSDDDRPADLGWVAVLDDGREVSISGLVLLGRNPQARPGEEGAELVKIADEKRTVSKTHLSLDVDPTGLFVMDRGSTNGTILTSARGMSRACPAGDVVPVDGGILSFGDHWLRIERRPGDGSSEG